MCVLFVTELSGGRASRSPTCAAVMDAVVPLQAPGRGMGSEDGPSVPGAETESIDQDSLQCLDVRKECGVLVAI